MKTVSTLLILLSASSVANQNIDDERLLASLVKQGIICEDQTELEKQASLQIYLSKKFSNPSDKKLNTSTPKSTDCISAKNNE
ncbi:hypothetical protein [Vibrio pacinii]|uniref:hypothetical protein n=1 Tax=Vibrio pacinii TaxID=170674 RepID=UPI0005715865|nr:hypothetical protein [Vibrio pacinii]